MKLSAKGLLEIAEHEGIVPTVYLDSKGIPTYGVGHTKGAGAPDPANMSWAWPTDVEGAIDAALDQFRKDVRIYEDRVNQHVKVPLKQHEFDALVSFDFNTGGIWYRKANGQMTNALLVTAINARDPNASRHFFGWVKPPELRKRREQEKRLFDTGDYDHNGDLIPIWKTDGKGRLAGQHSVMRGADLLKRMGHRQIEVSGISSPVTYTSKPLAVLLALAAAAAVAYFIFGG